MIHSRALAVVTAVLLSAPLGRAADVDRFMPEDTEFVLNLNVRQIRDSELVKKNEFQDLAQEALRGNDQVQDVLKDLGFDPFKDLDRIIIATPVSTEKDRGLFIVHGRFDVAKFKAKAEAVAKDDEEHLKIRKVLGGKHLLYEVNVPELDDPLFVALANNNTLLASPGKDYVVDALKKIGKETKPVLKNKQFQALLEKIEERQSLSLAAVPGPNLGKVVEGASGDIKAMIEKIQALGGGLTVSDEIKLEFVVNTKDAKDAKELRDSAKAGLDAVITFASIFVQNNNSPAGEFLMEFLKSLRVANKGESVVLKGRISSDSIEDALKKKSK
ncbi:MAG: hypothetical protein ACYC3I_08180 [Gemmataceae bacterium]